MFGFILLSLVRHTCNQAFRSVSFKTHQVKDY